MGIIIRQTARVLFAIQTLVTIAALLGAAYWFSAANRQEARARTAEETSKQRELVINMLADEVKSCQSDRARAIDMATRMQEAFDRR